ncbi:hypothetical protein B0H63DRAFT_561304 [Podospora didyma]|uniref:Uncharacterized protein n=1 Tax=Podospora didyma TaxID=330526 RepID=A0AAE0NHJ5_9PEZI|nr:hypothetical protein B0H63DRAFT_561304 [Podospora didyma]
MAPRGRPRKNPASAAAAKKESPPSVTPEAPEKSRRRSTRVSSSGKTSNYFLEEEQSESSAFVPDDEDETTNKKKRKPKAVAAVAKSDKKTKRAKTTPKGGKVVHDDDDDDDDDYDTEAGATVNAGQEDSDDEIDEDAPPKVTFTPLIKLRDTGCIAYADDRIHKNTLLFLKDLKANNKRPWLKSRDAEYRRSLEDWETYVMSLTEKITAVDETIPELPFKDVNFRIYRDVRFSNDQTPYKPHYSAAFSRTGRKGPYACYYVHMEPGKSFIGGGLWHPDGPAVAKVRASIDERPKRWRRVLIDPEFRRVFLPSVAGPGVKEDEVIEAFAASNAENALKRPPKGFIPEHRDVSLLKLRNYTVWKQLDDAIWSRPGGQEEVLKCIKAMVGYVTHLNRIVMPDPNDDDDDSEDEEDEDE